MFICCYCISILRFRVFVSPVFALKPIRSKGGTLAVINLILTRVQQERMNVNLVLNTGNTP